MDYDIFENEQEKRGAFIALQALLKHNGWTFITKAIDANIRFISEQLKDKKDFKNLEEVYYLQERIDDLNKLKDLPELILEELKDLPEEDEDSDPYET